jgi:hypothetical protein
MADPDAPSETPEARAAASTPAPQATPAARTKPTRRRSLLAAGGRASLALIAAAAVAVLAAGVLLVPSPSVVAPVTSFAVTPDRTDQVLVCAGAALGLTRGDDPQVAAVAAPQLRSAGEGLIESSITTSDALDGGAAVVTLPREAPGAAVTATQVVRASTSDVQGLAAAECLPAARSAWLVGGATTVGRSTWVVLTNADDVDATVDLRVWADAGPIDAPGTSGIIVAAGTQRVIPLAGIAVDEASPVVHVASRGGSVAATLQTSTVRGLTPSGLSIVTPVSEPALRLVIPALPVIASEAVLEQATGDGAVDGLTALRLLAPTFVADADGAGDAGGAGGGAVSGDDAAVTVTLVPREGGTGLSTEVLLQAGTVVDLPFTGLLDGDYTVVIESDVPIVAAARTSTAGTATVDRLTGLNGLVGFDVEWFTPSPALEAGAEVQVSVAPLDGQQSALLHLYAPDDDAIVTIDGLDVTVSAGTSVVIPSAANTAVRLATSARIHASFSYRGDGLLAGSRVLGPPRAGQPLTVFPS